MMALSTRRRTVRLKLPRAWAMISKSELLKLGGSVLRIALRGMREETELRWVEGI